MLLSRNGISLLIWMVVFTVLITLFVVLRFWTAKLIKRALHADDYMVAFAYINILILQGATWWAIANGLGAHTSELDNYELGVQYKLIVASGVTWLLATVFVKLSILWLYTRIFTTRRFKYGAWALMGVVAGYGVAFLCVFLTNCQPISYSWHPVPGGSCKDLTIEELASVSLNMLIDVLIVLLPMRPLWRLQMATKNKIAISIMFSLGLVIVAIMAWRIQITNKSVTQTDFVYGLGTIGLVSHLEVWLGLIIACIPTLAPLMSRYIKPVVAKITGYSSKRSGHMQLKEAENTIGGTSGKNPKKKHGGVEQDFGLELEDGKHWNESVATGQITSEDRLWMPEPNRIGVTHDVQIDVSSR